MPQSEYVGLHSPATKTHLGRWTRNLSITALATALVAPLIAIPVSIAAIIFSRKARSGFPWLPIVSLAFCLSMTLIYAYLIFNWMHDLRL